MKRHLPWTVVLLLLSVMALSACATPPTPTQSSSEEVATGAEASEAGDDFQELRWSFPFSQRWDPARSTGFDFYAGNALVYGALTRYTADGEIVPWLAESWEVSDDGLEYTFKIREDLKYNTGNPVTAHDFKFSWERSIELGSLGARFLANVEGLQAFQNAEADEITGIIVEDDYTFRVVMTLPFISFPSYTTVATLAPVEPAQVAKDTAEKRWMEDGGGGAGPYMIESFDPDEVVAVLVPNPHYFGDPPNLDRITYMQVPDPQTRQLMYESGELDAALARGLDIVALSDPSNPLSAELKKADAGEMQFFPIRIDLPPFDDVKFREAFRYSIDHRGIVEAVLPYVDPLDSVAPPSSGWAGKSCNVEQDVERARQAFADSSYGGDPSQVPTITIYATPGSDFVRYLQAVQEQVRDTLGVQVDLVIKDSISDEERASMSINAWTAGRISLYPGYYMDGTWWGANEGLWSSSTPYQSDEVDALIAQAHATADVEENLALYEQVIDILCSEYLFLPGWNNQWILLVKPYVSGLFDHAYIDMPVDLEKVEVTR